MPDCMYFPKDWKEFLELYTNKSELIPCFRVEQLIEYYFPAKENKEPCYTCNDLEAHSDLYTYSSWDGGINFDEISDIQYCPRCGRRLLTHEEKKKRAEIIMKKICK